MTGLLTARQVADLLGVSAETVLRWTRRGDLPAIRLPGGAIRYREDALDDWLAARAVDCRAATADTRPTTSAPAPRQRPGAGHKGGLVPVTPEHPKAAR